MDDDDDVFKTSPRHAPSNIHEPEEESNYQQELSHKFDLDSFSKSVDTGNSHNDVASSAKIGMTRQFTEPERSSAFGEAEEEEKRNMRPIDRLKAKTQGRQWVSLFLVTNMLSLC